MRKAAWFALVVVCTWVGASGGPERTAGALAPVAAVVHATGASRIEQLDGLAEWYRDGVLVVDGQRVRTYENGYSRDLEDQADRVGLRYAYQGGYDVSEAPRLWRRFDEKYGSQNKVANYLFGGHSTVKDRVRNLERELALNYPDARFGRPRR